MDELRVVRREDNALIVATELGEEYRLVIDELVASEVRQATKRAPNTQSVRPREIQSLLRSGKTRAEVAAATGLDEADVERFEEPVRAEQRYILELAHAVPVRTEDSGADHLPEQRFGEVIAERLVGLGNTTSSWRSWRDEDAGWFIGLEFDSRDGDHDAVWNFNHRKRVLSPVSADATNLSKIGEIGDRLIPKLRAVDNAPAEQPAAPTFDPDALLAETGEHERVAPESAQRDEASDAEYERRREIEQRAMNSPSGSPDDLSQTADLLDALRRRRGEREQQEHAAASDEAEASDQVDHDDLTLDLVDGDWPAAPAKSESTPPEREKPARGEGAARNIWGAAGVSASPPKNTLRPVNEAASGDDEDLDQTIRVSPSERDQRDSKGSKKGRSSIPSWDDILFGTRSDDDPA